MMRNETEVSKRRSFYLLVSILAAVAMWFFVDVFGYNGGAYPAKVTIDDIPIYYTGEAGLAERGFMLLDENTSTTLDITVEGPRLQVVQLDRNEIRVTVNLNEVNSAGLQTVDYRISFADRRFSEDMITKRSMNEAVVNVAELHSKTVEIFCELQGNVAEGYSAGQLELSQETLEIRGEPAAIDPVEQVKVILDLGENTRESVSRDLEFLYYDAAGQLLSGYGIHPTVDTVRATLPVYVTKQLQLEVEFQEAPGVRTDNLVYEINPGTITVSGEAGQLNRVSTVVLGQLDLLKLLGSGEASYVYPIIIPEGCQNLSGVTQATLKVDFKDLVTEVISAGEISYTNLPEGKHIEILTRELPIRVFGKSADVAEVTGANISVVANLTNYSSASGSYSVPALVSVDAPVDVGVVGTYQVQVTIRDDGGSTENPETLPETGTPEETQTGETP